MKAVQIFTHAFRQVLGNLEAAIRISGLLFLVQFLAGWALISRRFPDEAALKAAALSGQFPWFTVLISAVISLVAGLWIAVAWHRYVLVIEKPGVLPVFHGDRILAYFGKGLLAGLILLVPAIVLGRGIWGLGHLHPFRLGRVGLSAFDNPCAGRHCVAPKHRLARYCVGGRHHADPGDGGHAR